jgi:hypothetical protein
MENPMRKMIPYALVALLGSSFAIAAGDVYRWKDANNQWHYSDQPRAGAELISDSNRRPVASTAARPVPRPVTVAATPAPSEPKDDPIPVSDAAINEVRAEAASAKADQCKKAEASYQRAIQARRAYKTDDKGNRVYLNDSDMDATRIQARGARDLACNP